MKKLVLITALFFTFFNAQAEGVSDWIHLTRKMGNITIVLDYRIGCYTYSQGTVCSANPFWMNVYGARPESQVHVVFLNYCPTDHEIREVDLGYNPKENKFTGDLPYGTHLPINRCRQELAVSVDGDWSTRYNGGRNFTLDLMNGR